MMTNSKNNKKVLRVGRETLRRLGSCELAAVGGGVLALVKCTQLISGCQPGFIVSDTTAR
jgi:hypothetical protein